LVFNIYDTSRFNNNIAKKAQNKAILQLSNFIHVLLKINSLNTINKIIENEISECNPEIIFTHFEYDNNNDHRVVYRSTMMAARPGIFDSIKSVISYEVPSSTEWSFSNAFQPNLFEVLSQECIDKKWRALLEYKSEVLPYPHPRSYEGLVTLARFRGMQTGVEFAEAYHLIRSMK